MGAQKARAMKAGGGGFDVDEFISKLITYMGGRTPEENGLDGENVEINMALDWEKIGRKALSKSRRAPAMDFMCVIRLLSTSGTDVCYRLGPLLIEQKKRAVGKRSRLEKNKDDLQKPQEIREEDIQRSENETTKNVLTVRSSFLF